jgi:hypothetical protein
MGHSAVQDLERRFLPKLRDLERSLKATYPMLQFEIWSGSTGGLTEYQGHDVGLECMFPNAQSHEANCVALMVGIKHLTSAPLLCDASVGWCAGSHPDVELSLIQDPLPLSTSALESVESRFLELAIVFDEAIQAWRLEHAGA